MIRKNLLLCKIFRIKISSKSLFDSYMDKFQPCLETCPICGSTGNCHIHDYYDRSLIDFRFGAPEIYSLCVMRVFCDSCEHAHAVLPDVIIPYSVYSLLFVLRLLGQYFVNAGNAAELFAQAVLPWNSSVKDMASHRTSSTSGSPYGNHTSRTGLGFWTIMQSLTFPFSKASFWQTPSRISP